MPQMYWIVPVEGGRHPDQGLPPLSPGYPDQGLPPLSPGQPSHPIYHPGHPDHGRPSHPIYNPAYPDQGLPGASGGHPSHPIHIPGVPDQGLPPGETIPPETVTPPTVPPGHEDDLIVAVRQPNATDWTYTSFDVAPDQGQPTPEPHKRGRRA